MINVIEKISFILILILPISLITGPAIPDISITLVGFIFLIIFYKKYFTYIFSHKWALVSIIFWVFLIFISIFSENQYLAFRESIIFIRILLIPIFIYFWILSDKNKINPVVFIIFFAVVFVCLDSIYQFTNYDPQTGFGKDILGYIPNFYSRLTGPFKDLVPGAYISKFSFIGLAFIYLYIYRQGAQNILTIIYLTLVGFAIYISNEKMALATFLLGFFILILFLKNKRIILLISLLCILFSIFLVNKFHPIYNDYRVIESTPYHLGLKVEKYFACKNNKNKICKKIVNLQPNFMQVIKNFSQSTYGQIYKLGLKMWKDHPLNGVGLNNFTYLCNYDQRYKNLTSHWSSDKSIFETLRKSLFDVQGIDSDIDSSLYAEPTT